ncbi:potassium channel family protein [Billgrantia montanilacus]|uniref:Two pore domain potassium channel family protein n=1 Tax=Billgrantia montanilacus TaxID=2282305 RepID=A0A368TRF9_9GAMM|nr:potassium channel family protein [Halomonas montanilacus]RCV87305.1 two pore domain potassium channel family protein [Halomonas montanilacus]
MAGLLALAGSVIVVLASYDAIQTTLSASRSGPITNRLIRLVWQPFLLIHRKFCTHGMLSAVGPWVTLMLVFVWVGLAWLGWWLLFCSEGQAVTHADTGIEASLVERAYFLGYTITTLGYGDFVPGSPKWQILAVLAAGNGLVLFTLAVTYIVAVVSAVVDKRQLAILISALGETPEQMLSNMDEGEAFEELADQVDALKGQIIAISEQHLAYPILHYYHASEPERALPMALARLYQTLTIICFACPTLTESVRRKLRRNLYAIESFLTNLNGDFVRPASLCPEIPDGAVPSLAQFDRSQAEIVTYLLGLERQRLWLAYVEKDGWEWEELWVGTQAPRQPTPG